MARTFSATGTTIGLIACCSAVLAQSDDDQLFPVHFDMYLAEDSPLYAFAVGDPCGRIVTLRANKLPVEVPMLRPVWAYELSVDGKIETTWAMPVDGTPLAVDGNRLTIHQFNAEEVVFVTTSFDIGTTLTGPNRAELEKDNERRECPVNAQTVDQVRFYWCSEMTDTTTGEVRLIAYAPVCA